MLQKVYDTSPVPLQHVMATLKGYRLNHERHGRLYRNHRQWLADFDRLSYEEKLAHQEQALAAFVRHAYEHSAYYRNSYDAAGVDVTSIHSLADLTALPTVDKEDIRANAHDVMVSEGVGRTVVAQTGGTTGKSLYVSCSIDDLQHRMAVLDHFKARVGFEHRRMRRASFSGRHLVPSGQRGGPYVRRNLAARQLLLSSFHLNETTAAAYLGELNRFRPKALDGFPSGLLTLARHMLAHGIRLDHEPMAIFPTAETVTDADREVLETAYGAKVYNQYASSEGAPFITECTAGRLHVEMSTGVFEFIDGEIVVTSFSTHATPLIRYRIGDRATPSTAHSCPCGNESEMVEQLTGRGSQFLYRSDGTRVYSPHLANIFKHVPNAIIEAQLTQRRLGTVELSVVVDGERAEAFDDVMRDQFAHKFDPATSVIIQHVDMIPTEVSGKRPFVKNLVDGEWGGTGAQG